MHVLHRDLLQVMHAVRKIILPLMQPGCMLMRTAGPTVQAAAPEFPHGHNICELTQ